MMWDCRSGFHIDLYGCWLLESPDYYCYVTCVWTSAGDTNVTKIKRLFGLA